MCKNKMKTFGYKNRIEKENKITIENKKVWDVLKRSKHVTHLLWSAKIL